MNKTFQIVLITLTISCLIASSISCSVRTNNEKFFYKSAINQLDRSLSSRTRKICGYSDFRSQRYPIFNKTDDLPKDLDGEQFYNTISYRNLYVIPHETIHYLIFMHKLSPECVEEMLADVINLAVYERERK